MTEKVEFVTQIKFEFIFVKKYMPSTYWTCNQLFSQFNECYMCLTCVAYKICFFVNIWTYLIIQNDTLLHTQTSTLLKIDCLFQYFDMKFAYISKNGIYIHVLATWHRCPVII